MIAMHNIKVNGKWYRAGEEVPEKAAKAVKKEAPAETKPVEPIAEEKTEPQQHNAGRRKNGK